MKKDYHKTINLKKLKMVSLGFFDILQLPHNVISITEKLTHPTVQQRSLRLRNVEYGFILAQDLYCEYVILRKSSSLTEYSKNAKPICCPSFMQV